MAQVIRRFLLVEAATFITAAAIHGGGLISGYEHREARIAESIIAAVLLGGAAVAWAKPARTSAAGLFGHRAIDDVDGRGDGQNREQRGREEDAVGE